MIKNHKLIFSGSFSTEAKSLFKLFKGGGLHWAPSQYAGLGAPCRLRTFTRPPPALKTVHVSPPRRRARRPKISSSRLWLQFVCWNSYGRLPPPFFFFFSRRSERRRWLHQSWRAAGTHLGSKWGPVSRRFGFFFREKDKTSSKRRDDWPRCWSGDPIMGRYNVKEGAVTMQPPCWALGPNGARCDFI